MVTIASPSSLIVDVVDQPELVDVDRDFGVVDRLQRLDDGRLEVAARRRPPALRLLAGEEAGEIVALALEASRRHAGARRRRSPRRLPRSRSCVPRSSENPLHLLDPAHQRLDVRAVAVRREARARGRRRRRASRISGCAQWWPARTATPASSNMVAVSCGCTPSTLKLTIPALSSGPYSVTPWIARQRGAASRRPARIRARGSRRAPMLSTQSTAACSPIAPTMCGVPASNRAGGSRKVVSSNVTCSIIAPPPCHGGIAASSSARAPQAADAGRAVELVRRRRRRSRQPIAATSTGSRGTAWQPSSSSSAPFECAISAARFASRIEPSTFETWAKATTRCSFGQHRLGGVEVDLAVGGQRHDVDLVAGELPRHDVAVMLELREQDAVAALLRQRARDEVDRLGRAAGEDELVRPGRRSASTPRRAPPRSSRSSSAERS